MSAIPEKSVTKFNVIRVTKGWVGVKFAGEKRYVTLEWPHSTCNNFFTHDGLKRERAEDRAYVGSFHNIN